MILQQLPEKMKDVIFSEESADINFNIAQTFGLDDEQKKEVLQTLVKVFIGAIAPLDLPSVLSTPSLQGVDVRQLALALAEKRLWPVHEYIPNVDVLIRRLGGSIPAEPTSVASEGQSSELLATAQEFISQNADNKKLLLTPSLKSRGSEQGTIEQWLKDFLHMMGPVMSDGLARSQYLMRSQRAGSLSPDDKETLLLFLSSYGDNSLLRWRIENNTVIILPPQQSPVESPEHGSRQTNSEIDDVINHYQEFIANLKATIESRRSNLQVEIGDQAARLADTIWNSLGLEERERVVTAVVIAAERRSLSQIITQDLRFVGIMRRSISVRFGEQAKNKWQPQATSADYALFLQLILQDKLHYTSDQAAMIGHYIESLLKLEPITYIDVLRQEFRFRELTVVNNSLILVK